MQSLQEHSPVHCRDWNLCLQFAASFVPYALAVLEWRKYIMSVLPAAAIDRDKCLAFSSKGGCYPLHSLVLCGSSPTSGINRSPLSTLCIFILCPTAVCCEGKLVKLKVSQGLMGDTLEAMGGHHFYWESWRRSVGIIWWNIMPPSLVTPNNHLTLPTSYGVLFPCSSGCRLRAEVCIWSPKAEEFWEDKCCSSVLHIFFVILDFGVCVVCEQCSFRAIHFIHWIIYLLLFGPKRRPWIDLQQKLLRHSDVSPPVGP